MMAEDGDDNIKKTRINNTLIPVANPVTAAALVDIAVLMRNDRGSHNFYALHVRTDNSKSAKAVSQNSLKAAREAGAAADVEIDSLDRYDMNIVTGVLNAIEERDITEVMLGMHRRMTVIDSFFGAKVEQLLRSTNKMLIISRCFIPANTLTRIVVWVPADAQYETGFSRWVRAVARLTRQVGCRIIFCCPGEVQPMIRGVIYTENYGIRCEFKTINSYDDMILLSGEILDDDLFVLICARAQSVSYRSEMSELPSFLQRNFSHHNLMVIYPEQFGEAPQLVSFTDPLASDIASAPSPIFQSLRSSLRTLWRKWR